MQEAQEAWWPPTLRPSRLGRMWLALWIIQAESQSSLRSTWCNRAMWRGSWLAGGDGASLSGISFIGCSW